MSQLFKVLSQVHVPNPVFSVIGVVTAFVLTEPDIVISSLICCYVRLRNESNVMRTAVVSEFFIMFVFNSNLK